MKRLMHLIVLSCLKATELIEKRMDHKLNFVQNLQLTMHKSMCKACLDYEKQSFILDDVLKHPLHKDVVMIDLDKFKSEIIAKISE